MCEKACCSSTCKKIDLKKNSASITDCRQSTTVNAVSISICGGHWWTVDSQCCVYMMWRPLMTRINFIILYFLYYCNTRMILVACTIPPHTHPPHPMDHATLKSRETLVEVEVSWCLLKSSKYSWTNSESISINNCSTQPAKPTQPPNLPQTILLRKDGYHKPCPKPSRVVFACKG